MERSSRIVYEKHLDKKVSQLKIGTMAATRILILIAAAIFVMAALLHFGMLLDGYAHERARIPETVIAIVLLIGLVLSWRPPPWGRRAAITAQGFAILGILVGLTMIAIGIGPRTGLDFAIHAAMLTVLIIGLVSALLNRCEPRDASEV
jgi:uncharacterized membrane protein YhiD involved in acid resistance